MRMQAIDLSLLTLFDVVRQLRRVSPSEVPGNDTSWLAVDAA